MTEPDCKSLLVSVIRNDIVENSMVDEWDEKEKGCDWIRGYMHDLQLLGNYDDEDDPSISESNTVKKIQKALANNYNITFLCHFYLFSVVGGSSHPLYELYLKVQKEGDEYKHPLIEFKTKL
jgi:hypothetical protein